MINKDYIYVGLIAVLAVSLGFIQFTGTDGYEYYMSSDTATVQYSCDSPLMKSDCINGLKACNEDTGVCTRCYYDLTNGRKYKSCSEGWAVYSFNPTPSDSTQCLQQRCTNKDGIDLCVCV